MEDRNPYNNQADANKGFKRRGVHTNRSHSVDMIGGIHSDLFFQDKYKLSDVGMRIRLVRNKDAFRLMAAAGSTFKVKIVSCTSGKLKLVSLFSLRTTKPWRVETLNIPSDLPSVKRTLFLLGTWITRRRIYSQDNYLLVL